MHECFLCGKNNGCERHHLIGGTAKRRLSEKYGLVVWLCPECHRTGKHAAHRDAETARYLHEYAEQKWMAEQGGTIEDFISVFGKNYL